MTTQAAVVLAAGRGTRMKSQTPKVLHRVCGLEMVRLVVDAARAARLDPIVVVVPRDGAHIRSALKSGVSYAVQPEAMGTGHALLQAEPSLGSADQVTVLNGDVPLISSVTLSKLSEHHRRSGACVTLMVSTGANPAGMGRIVRSPTGAIVNVVEDEDTDEESRPIEEVNGGVYCFEAGWLWSNLGSMPPSPSGEVRITDLVALAAGQGMAIESVRPESEIEALGVNTRVALAKAEAFCRERIRERWMLGGVTLSDPSSVYIDAEAEIGQDTIVLPNTHLLGATRIGQRCTVGPNSIVDGSRVGDECSIVSSVIEHSTIDDRVSVGPFSRIRGGARLESDVYVGTHAEVKGSRLGPGTKSSHFSYIGDADVGANVNIGAGAVTCNYDGERKNRTTIGDDAFIGSDTMLVAPVKVGARSSTGAGAVVTRDVPEGSLAVGVPARVSPKKRDLASDPREGL
jgi:bifunctional UDP-N-acetylglucosamine pyrophosphorylase/glucosamine-1-phosphate N-acetyltransferase